MCITVKELDQKVSEVRSLKALKEGTENKIKALERDIINFLVETEQQNGYIGTDYKASYKSQSRSTLDKAKLESDLGSLSDYEKVTTFGVLRIV